MKVLPLVINGLALRAVGVAADLKTIQGSFVGIQTAASTLNGAILNVNTSPESAAGIAPAAKGVEDALAKARDDVGNTDPITLADDPVLQSTANGLSSTVKIMIMSSMLQRPMLDMANATTQLLNSLQMQDMLAGQLGMNVLSKLPPEGIPGAQMAFGGAAGSIKIGITMLSQPAPPGMTMPGIPTGPPGGMAAAPPGGAAKPPAPAPAPAANATSSNATAAAAAHAVAPTRPTKLRRRAA